MNKHRLHACLGALGASVIGMSAARTQAQDLDNIPTAFVELRITTCDVAGADTDDDVSVDFNFIDVDDAGKRSRSKSTYVLDNPGDDRARGASNRYLFPGFEQLSRLDSIQLRKSGSDAWCVSGLDVRVNGQGTVMSFRGEDLDADYLGAHRDTPTRVWINDGRKDAQALSINFSDTESVSAVKIPGNVTMKTLPNPVFLTIKPLLGVDSNKQITVVWRHDGVQGDRIRFPQPKGESASVFLGADIDVIESLELQMDDTKEGGFTTEEVNITGLNPFAASFLHDTQVRLLGKMGFNAESRLPLVTKPVNARAGRTPMDHGFVHLPLRRSGTFEELNDTLVHHGTDEQAQCQPPQKIENLELERLIGTLVVGMWKDSCSGVECSWGDHTVTITRGSASKLHAHVQFRVTATGPKGGEYHVHPEVEFDLTPDCDDNVVSVKATNIKLDMNLNIVEQWLVDLIRIFDTKLDKALDKIHVVKTAEGSKRVPQCPSSITLNDDASISLTWPTPHLPPPFQNFTLHNVMCLAP